MEVKLKKEKEKENLKEENEIRFPIKSEEISHFECPICCDPVEINENLQDFSKINEIGLMCPSCKIARKKCKQETKSLISLFEKELSSILRLTYLRTKERSIHVFYHQFSRDLVMTSPELPRSFKKILHDIGIAQTLIVEKSILKIQLQPATALTQDTLIKIKQFVRIHHRPPAIKKLTDDSQSALSAYKKRKGKAPLILQTQKSVRQSVQTWSKDEEDEILLRFGTTGQRWNKIKFQDKSDRDILSRRTAEQIRERCFGILRRHGLSAEEYSSVNKEKGTFLGSRYFHENSDNLTIFDEETSFPYLPVLKKSSSNKKNNSNNNNNNKEKQEDDENEINFDLYDDFDFARCQKTENENNSENEEEDENEPSANERFGEDMILMGNIQFEWEDISKLVGCNANFNKK